MKQEDAEVLGLVVYCLALSVILYLIVGLVVG